MNSRTKNSVAKAIILVDAVIIIAALSMHIVAMNKKEHAKQSAPAATKQMKVVNNSDKSVVVKGNASFAMMPVSNNPPAMVPENDVKKLSSRK